MPALPTSLTAGARWPNLVASVEALPRATGVRDAAASYVPSFGDLGSRDARVLAATVDEALDGALVVPVHSTESQWAAPMLEDGFRWPRWRDVDGYEPYEDKLAEWGALGSGERSEDFIFAELRVLRGGSSLGAALRRDSAAMRERGLGGAGTGYGEVTLAFDPRSLANATLLPAVATYPFHGGRAATIEHLPELLASRLAGDHGMLAAMEASGLRLNGHVAEADEVLAGAPALQRRLLELVRSGHDERLAGVRELVYARPLSTRGWRNPIEAHVRGLTPQDVVRVEVEPATVTFAAGSGAQARAAVRELSGLVPATRLDEIEHAARSVGAVVAGFDEQRSLLAAARRSPGATVEFIEDPAASTAVGTAQLRRQMAAARAARG
jgi:hypothetical protein